MPLILVWLLGKPAAVEHHGYQASCPNGLLLMNVTALSAPDISWLADRKMHRLQFRRSRLVRKPSPAAHDLPAALAVPTSFQQRNHNHSRGDASIYRAPERSTTESKPWNLARHNRREIPRKSSGSLTRQIRPRKGRSRPVARRSAFEKSGCNFELTVIGDGPERSNLEAFTAELGMAGRVTFAGQLQRQKVE